MLRSLSYFAVFLRRFLVTIFFIQGQLLPSVYMFMSMSAVTLQFAVLSSRDVIITVDIQIQSLCLRKIEDCSEQPRTMNT